MKLILKWLLAACALLLVAYLYPGDKKVSKQRETLLFVIRRKSSSLNDIPNQLNTFYR